jgi:serine/threonine protein kinase
MAKIESIASGPSDRLPAGVGEAVSAARPDLSRGLVRFGNYDLILLLGHGGMADVYLAVYSGQVAEGFSKLIVIKRLRENLAEEPEFIEMLVDEARLAARLNHPNVVQTNEIGLVDKQYFIAMEYLDGQPLNRISHRAKAASAKAGTNRSSIAPGIPLPIVLTLLCDMLAGLEHAHELNDYDGTPLNIVHRDVSPQNVFVTYAGQVKLVDFGIAKAVGRSVETRRGVVKGKIAYMAPEQLTGAAIDRRTDVFAVGIVLWELLTGMRMWNGLSDVSIFNRLIAGDILRSPKMFNPDVPDEVDRICQRALAPEPANRYASAAQFQSDLELYLRSQNAHVSARELGDFVSTLFADKRAEIRLVIDSRWAELRERGSSARTTEGATAEAVLEVDISVPITATAIEPVPPKSRVRRVLAVAAAMAVLGGTVVAAQRPGLFRKAAPAPALPALAALGSASASEPAKEVPPERPLVQLEARATPAAAKLFLDGAPLANPTHQNFQRDGLAHTLRAEAAGYVADERTIAFVGPEEKLEFALVPAKPSVAPPHVASGGAKRPFVGRPRPATRTPSRSAPAASPAEEAAAPPQPAVTATAKKSGAKPPPLDAANPWSTGAATPSLETQPWRK